jgi:hypothetical protein
MSINFKYLRTTAQVRNRLYGARLVERLKFAGVSARSSLRLSKLVICSKRLSARSLPRSAAPLASAGIICLGLVPTLGGPDLPLHWAMTLGITGFGVLLAVRHRLRRAERPLALVPRPAAEHAGRSVLIIAAICTALVLGIIGRQLLLKGPVGPLSVAMPLAALGWLYWVGLRALRWSAETADEAQPSADDRPSRRPSWERMTPPGPSASGGSRHVSA